MAEVPDNLVLKLLRELRTEQGATREDIRDLRMQVTRMSNDLHGWQETVATASGFAMHANLRTQALETEMAELRQRVDKLEQAK